MSATAGDIEKSGGNRLLLLILAAALVLRLFWVLHAQSEPPPVVDPQWYYAVASNLAEGRGFTMRIDSEPADTGASEEERQSVFAAGPGGSATTLWPPGWPASLAAVFFVFGTGLTAGKLLNVVAGVLTVYLVYRIGELLFGRRVGLIGAAIIAFYPNHIFWSSTLYADVYFTAWFCLALFVLLRTKDWRGSRSLWAAALLGAIIGVASLVRGQGLLLPLYALVLWGLFGGWTEAFKRTVVVVGAMLIVILPWTVRNVLTFDEPILISANDGFNLRIGHSPYATGRFVTPKDLWALEPGIGQTEREALFSREGRELAWEYATSHPADEVELSLKKLYYLFIPDSDALEWANYASEPVAPSAVRSALIWLADGYYWTLLLFAAVGLVVGRRMRAVRWMAFVFASWAVFHVVFFAEPRFHIPLLPLAALTAAIGLPAVARLWSAEAAAPARARGKREAAIAGGRRRKRRR